MSDIPTITSSEFDLTFASRWLDGDADALREHVERFLVATEARLAVLQDALNQKDCKRATDAAHKLRGGFVNVGALHQVALAGEIEAAARNGVTHPLDNVVLATGDLVVALNGWIETGNVEATT